MPFSLLELNTFGHAVCALFIYILWWEKPTDVDYPTFLQNPTLRKIAALRWMNHKRSPEEKFISLSYRERLVCLGQDKDPGCEFRLVAETIEHEQPAEPHQDFLAPGEILPGTGFRLRRFTYDLNLRQDTSIPQPAIKFTVQDTTRWRMAWQALGICTPYEATDAFTERVDDFPNSEKIFDPAILFGLGVAAFIYGGLHASAWSAHFVSTTEKLLWRMSSCVMMGGFFAQLIIIEGHNWAWNKLIDISLQGDSVLSWLVRILRITIDLLYYLMVYLIPFAFALARVYLVVGCFINISYLPASVYDIPTWSAYIPHIA